MTPIFNALLADSRKIGTATTKRSTRTHCRDARSDNCGFLALYIRKDWPTPPDFHFFALTRGFAHAPQGFPAFIRGATRLEEHLPAAHRRFFTSASEVKRVAGSGKNVLRFTMLAKFSFIVLHLVRSMCFNSFLTVGAYDRKRRKPLHHWISTIRNRTQCGLNTTSEQYRLY